MGGITRGVTQAKVHYHGVYEKWHRLSCKRLKLGKIKSKIILIIKFIPTPRHTLYPLPWSANYSIAMQLVCLMHRKLCSESVIPMMSLLCERRGAHSDRQ